VTRRRIARGREREALHSLPHADVFHPLQGARGFAAAGDPARSRQSYDEFLTLWKDADPDLPVLGQARSESARMSLEI
jgi:hypothetical protein